MKYVFDNASEVIARVEKEPSITELEAEPMLFSAGLGLAFDNGGPLTRDIICHLPTGQCPKDKYIVIDTRVHMLMEGMYPAIPGWHGDGFPRQEKGSQPDLKAFDPEVEHFVCLLGSNGRWGTSKTEFYTKPVELDIWESRVWQSVDMQMADHRAHRMNVQPGEIVRFNQRTLHRATPCVEAGWRLFFRMSFYHRPPTNKIRRQTQVYTTESQGW